ncbi:SsrA-binding protein SmpB [Candidatus Fermentibacteria bacterium]|nr:SsrA-binding protein SmpB [Candidatus Fermentibacteria bacterium]
MTRETTARNRKAWHDYEVLESLEVGIVLAGSEIKSIRDGRVYLTGSYAQFDDEGELWAIQMHVGEYPQARDNHDPHRPRKLLAHRRELLRLRRRVEEKGLTLIPLDVHFSRGRAKILLGLCRGKRQHDRREDMAKRDDERRMQAVMKSRRN